MSIRGVAGFAAATILAATLTSCSLLAGASDEPVSNPVGNLEKSSITVALPKTIDATPLPLAMKKGYFKDEGLDVKFIQVPGGGAALEKLLLGNGDVDIAFSTYAPFFVAESQNAAQDKGGIKIIADASSASPGSAIVVAPPDSPVKSGKPETLANATVAVTDPTSISKLLICSALKTNGVGCGKIRWKPTPFSSTADALKNKLVDAAFVVEPFIQEAHKKAGAEQVLDVATGPTADFPTAGWGSTGNFTSKNPHVVAAFQRAMQKATDWAIDHRPDIETLSVDFAGVDYDTAKMAIYPTLQSKLDATRLNRVPELLLTFDAIKTPIDANTMIVPSAPLN